MMGVYIKGMEMPKNCIECPFSDHEAWCLIPGGWKERYYCPKDKISEYCPLVQVPPHGRLIDADALPFVQEYEPDALDYIRRYTVERAPTIIPAEEVYDQYTDTAGNFHWCGTHSGEHTVPIGGGET